MRVPQQNGCLGVEQLGRADAEVGVNVGPHFCGAGVASHAANPSATFLLVMFESQPRQLGKHLHLPGDLRRDAPHGKLAALPLDEVPISAPTARLLAKLATLLVCLVLLWLVQAKIAPCLRPPLSERF